MTKSSPHKLAYQKTYNALPKMVKRREQENLARQQAIRAGVVHVGDGKDVDHIKPLDNGGTTTPGNERVTTEKVNRGWRKGQSGYNPGKQPK